MTTVELTRFRVEADREGELLRARAAMLADFPADRHHHTRRTKELI